jgi:TolB-like protein/class 3 adenylate cyclase
MCADVVGYSRLMGIDGEGSQAALNAVRRNVIDPTIVAHKGRVVRTMGDGFLVEFNTVVDAVRCAVEVQREMSEQGADVPADRQIRFRVGIAMGDVIADGDLIHGEGVDIASRMESLTEPGGINVSRAVRDQVRGHLPIVFEDLGEHELKNVAHPIGTFRIVLDRPTGVLARAAAILAAPGCPALAVLPFRNLSDDAEAEFLFDSVAEDLITKLARAGQFSVVARQTSSSFKRTEADPTQLARELEVRYVVEGSFRKVGDRVRINCQLVEAESGELLWAARHDGTLEDLFGLGDRISQHVIGCVASMLRGAEIERPQREPAEPAVDSIRDLLQRLENVKGNTRAQSAVTAEALVMARQKSEQEPFRAALDAAAVLHWFDAELLETMLTAPQGEARRCFEDLKEHSFVERYSGEKEERYNLHESTRLGWRIKLASESLERFRSVSAQAASCFADNGTPSGRIEWVYHLLCADPDLGASELERLDRLWTGIARPEDRYALAAALQELADTDLIKGRARAWSLLTIGWTRDARGETAQLAEIAEEALQLASEAGDKPAEADARCLTGDVLRVRGELGPAQKAYDEFLSIRRHLAEQDPSDAGWRRELAVAYGRVGGALEAQGQLMAAQVAFDQSLMIRQQLAAQDPSNTGWQRELAVAYGRVGGVLQAKGQLAAAQAAFDQSLTIRGQLVEHDQANAGWRRDLAVAHNRVGSVLQAQGQLMAAQAAFDKALAINRWLAEQDLSNAGWQRELATAHRWVGDVLQAQGQPAVAQAAFDQALTISRRLAEQDPTNAGWQRDLAAAYGRIGSVLETQGQLVAAQAAFDQALTISQRLAEQDPSNAGWQRDLAVAHSRVGDVLQTQGLLEAAQAAFDQGLTINRRLAEQDPSNAGWQRDLAAACGRLGHIEALMGEKNVALALYEEALRIFTALIDRTPGFAAWANEVKTVEEELAALRATVAPSPDGAADQSQTP